MRNVTEKLGLAITKSTTYFHPYEVARIFATLDHLSQGRVAWNIVTSLNQAEAQNFGIESTSVTTSATTAPRNSSRSRSSSGGAGT